MAGLTGTEVLYKRENNMGVTTLTFRKRRYMYPEVIVKGEHDLSHSASTGDLENKGMCVMLDVGMFCPHCSGAISARLSGSRSKLIISKQNPHAVPLQSRHSLELEYSHPPIQEISFDKPEGGEEPVSSMQAATGPPSKHAKIKKIKTEQHGRMEETQLQMTLDCESPVSAHSHTYSPGKLEGIDKMSSSDYASLDRDSRFSSFGSTANSTETCVSVTGTGGIMTTKSDEAYNSMASSSHRPNNKVKPKVPPKPSLYRMPPLGSKYSSLPRDVHLSPINDTSADEKLILDSMQVDVSDTNEEVLVDELLSDEIIDEEYQNLVNGYKARNIRSNNLPKEINNDSEDTILHKQNNEYQSDKDVDIFSEKTDMNLEQSSGNISERSTSPELLVDDVLENMESEIFSGDVTLPRVFAIQKERRKKNSENKKKMKHIVDQHSKISSYETNTNDQTDSRNTESNKVNKKQTASAPSTLQRKALRERVKAKYKNIVSVPDPNLPSQLKPGFSHEDFFEDVLEALTDLEEESISDWTSDYDSEGKDLHLSTPDSEGHGYESGDMKVTLDNYGMNRHKTNTSSLECIADDRSHDLDSSLERLHSAGIPSSLDDGGSSSEGSLSGHDVSPKEQNGMLFKQLIQNTRHLTDELLTSTEEDHRDVTRECLSPGREQFDLMDEVFVDNPSEPMQERTAQTAVLEYQKHGTYTSSETNESSISVSHVPVIQQDSMTEDMPPINTPLKRRPRSDGDDSVLSEDIDSSLENLLSSNAMHASTSDLDEPLSIELHNSGYDNNEDVNDSETIITKDFEKCLHTDTTEVDEFVPETDEYAARPEVLKHAHDAARYIASFLGNHNITKFDQKKLSTNDDSSEKPNNNQAAFDSAVENGEWKNKISQRETKVASFDSKENITKEQAKQLMKYVLDKSSHIHHSKEHTTDLDACLDEVCQTCEFKPTGEKDIVKNEEVTTQEVTLVFKWPKKKSKRFGNEMPTIIPSIPRELPPPALKPKPQQPFRTIHLRRVMRVSDFDVEVLEGPTMATIEYSKDGSTKKTIQQGPVKKAVTESSDTKVEESPSNDSIETAQLDTLSGFETENEIETENISTTSHVVVKDNDQSCETEIQQNVLVQAAEHDYEDQQASQEVSSLIEGYSRLQGTVSDTNVSKVSEEIYTGRKSRSDVQVSQFMETDIDAVDESSELNRQNLHKEGKDVSDARFIDQNERNVYLLNLSQYFVPQTMSSKDISSTDTPTVAQENAMSLLSESSVCPKCNEEYTYEEMTMDDSGTKLQYLPYKFRRFGHPMPCERCLRLEREIKEKLVELTSIVEDMNKRRRSLSKDKWTSTDSTEGYPDSDNLESDLTDGYNMYKDNSMIQEDITEQHLHSEIQSTEVKTEHKRTVQNLDLEKSGSGELSLPWLENALQMDFELDKPYTLDKYADNLSKYIMFRAKLYFVLENTSTLPPNKLPGFDVMGRTELRARGVGNITGSVSKSLDSVGNGSISVHDEVMGFGDKDLAKNTKFIGSNVASTDESCNVGLSSSVFALHDNGTLVDKSNLSHDKTVPDHVSRGVQTENQLSDSRNPKYEMHVTNSRHISNEVKSVVNRVFSMLVPEHIHSNVNNDNTKSMQPDVLEPNAHVHSSLHDAPSNTHAYEQHSIPTINLSKIRNEASDEVKSLEHVSSSPDIQISDCQVCNVSSIGSSDSLNIPNAEIESTMSDGKEHFIDHAGSFEDVTVCADGESNDKLDLGGKDEKYSTEQKNLNEVGGKHAKLVNNHQLPTSLHPDDMTDQRITEGTSQFRNLESFRNRARHEALLQAKLEQNMKEIQDELAIFKMHMPPTEQDMKPSIPQVSQEVKSVVNQAFSFLLGDSSTTQRSSENSESPKENENIKHREISIEPESSLEEGPSIASNQPVPHGPDSEEYSCQASAPLLQVVNKNEDNSFSIDAEYTLNIPANNPSVEIESTNSDGNEHSNENVTVSFADVTSTVCADGESNNKISLVGKDEESSIEQKNMNEMGIKRAEMVNNHQLPTSLPSDDMEDQRSMGEISKLGDLESFRNRVRHEALLQTKLEQNMKEIQDELAELKKHMPPTEQDMKPSIPQLSQEVKSAVNQAFSFLLGDSSTTQRSSENSESPKENENMKHREISTEPEISVEEDSSLASNESSPRKPDSEEHCCQALTHSLGAVNGNRDNSVDTHLGFLEMDHSNTDIAIEHHVAVTSGVSTGPLPDLLVDQGITDRDARSYGPLSLEGLRPMHINHMGYQLDQQISCSMDLESGMATEHNIANMDIDETDSVCVGETNIGIAGEPNIEILDIDINPVEEETMPGSSHLCIKKHLPANTEDQEQCSESILLADYCPIELSGKGSQETITDSHLILVDHDDGIKVTDSLLEFDSPSLTAPIEDSDDETFESFLEFDYIGSSSSSEGEYCLYSREAYSPAEFEQGMKVEDELFENKIGNHEFDDDDSEREVETQMEDHSDHLSDMCMSQDSRQDEISSPFDKKTNITIRVDDLLGNVNENMDNDDTFGEPLHSTNHKTYSAGSEVQVDSRMVSQAIQDPEDRREPTHGNVIVKSKKEKKDAKLVKRIIADLDVYNYGVYVDDSSSSSISDDMSSLASSEFSDASGLTVIHIPCSSDKSESDGDDTPNKVVDMARLIQEQAEGMTNAAIPREFHHLQNTSDFNNGKELDDLEQVWIKRQQCTEPLSKSCVRKGIHDYKGGSFAAMNYKRPESCCLPLSISSEAIKQKVQPTSSHKSSISSSDSALLRQNLHVDLRVSELDERQQNQQEAKHFIEQKSQVAEGLSEKQHDMCQRLQLLKADFDRMLADVKQVKDQFIQTHEKHKQSVSSLHEFALQTYENDPVASGVARSRAWLQQHTLPLPEYKEIHKSHSCDAIRNRKKAPNFELGESSSDPVLRTHASTPESSVIGVPQPKKSTCQLLPCLGSSQNDNSDEDEHMTSIPTISEDDESIADDKNLEDTRESVYTSLSGSSDTECNGSDEIPPRPVSRLSFNHKASKNPWIDDNDDSTPYRRWSETDIEYIRPVLDKDPDKLRADLEERMSRALAHVEQSKPIDRKKSPDCSDESAEQSSIPQGNFSKHVQLYAPYFHYRKSRLEQHRRAQILISPPNEQETSSSDIRTDRSTSTSPVHSRQHHRSLSGTRKTRTSKKYLV